MSSDPHDKPRLSGTVQVLSLIFYSGFAIPVSIVAIVEFWPAGIALTAFFAYQWSSVLGLRQGTPMGEAVAALRPQTEARPPQSSGNASFDAYREELLERLETEQSNFEGFLHRLRQAKDKSEFDQFMEDRARIASTDQ